MRLVFLGTSDFAAAALRSLVASRHEVALVITQPDRPAGRGRRSQPGIVRRVAEEEAIPLSQPQKINTRATRAEVAALRPDVLVVVSFGQILRPLFLALAPEGCLNIHGSILPRHRGASPIQAQILAGDSEVGVSIMKMNEGLDTGPVGAQAVFAARPGESAGQLHDRLAAAGAALIVEVLDHLEAGSLEFRPQDDNLATLAPLIKKAEGQLDLRLSGEELLRRHRAYQPWPGSFLEMHNQGKSRRLMIEDFDFHALVENTAAPGTILSADKAGISVACANGLLCIKQLKPAGKRSMSVAEFLVGNPIEEGAFMSLPDRIK